MTKKENKPELCSLKTLIKSRDLLRKLTTVIFSNKHKVYQDIEETVSHSKHSRYRFFFLINYFQCHSDKRKFCVCLKLK